MVVIGESLPTTCVMLSFDGSSRQIAPKIESAVITLPSGKSSMSAAQPIAERIRNRVAEVRVEGFGEPIRLTCSIGVATSDTLGVWGEHLIARADEAVYDAKRSGRNRVQIAGAVAV